MYRSMRNLTSASVSLSGPFRRRRLEELMGRETSDVGGVGGELLMRGRQQRVVINTRFERGVEAPL